MRFRSTTLRLLRVVEISLITSQRRGFKLNALAVAASSDHAGTRLSYIVESLSCTVNPCRVVGRLSESRNASGALTCAALLSNPEKV
jgi:hypothetical protein